MPRTPRGGAGGARGVALHSPPALVEREGERGLCSPPFPMSSGGGGGRMVMAHSPDAVVRARQRAMLALGSAPKQQPKALLHRLRGGLLETPRSPTPPGRGDSHDHDHDHDGTSSAGETTDTAPGVSSVHAPTVEHLNDPPPQPTPYAAVPTRLRSPRVEVGPGIVASPPHDAASPGRAPASSRRGGCSSGCPEVVMAAPPPPVYDEATIAEFFHAQKRGMQVEVDRLVEEGLRQRGPTGAGGSIDNTTLREFFAQQKGGMKAEVDRLVEVELERRAATAAGPGVGGGDADVACIPRDTLQEFFRQQKHGVQVEVDRLVQAELARRAEAAPPAPTVGADTLRAFFAEQKLKMKSEVDRLVAFEMEKRAAAAVCTRTLASTGAGTAAAAPAPQTSLQKQAGAQPLSAVTAQYRAKTATPAGGDAAEHLAAVAPVPPPVVVCATTAPAPTAGAASAQLAGGAVDGDTLRAFMKERKEEMQATIDGLEASLRVERQRRVAAEAAAAEGQQLAVQHQQRQGMLIRELREEVEVLRAAREEALKERDAAVLLEATRTPHAPPAMVDAGAQTRRVIKKTLGVGTGSYETLMRPVFLSGMEVIVSAEASARAALEEAWSSPAGAMAASCAADAKWVGAPHPARARLTHFEKVLCALGPVAGEVLGIPPIALRAPDAAWCDLQDPDIVARAVAAWGEAHAVDAAEHMQLKRARHAAQRAREVLAAVAPLLARILPAVGVTVDIDAMAAADVVDAVTRDADPAAIARAVRSWLLANATTAVAAAGEGPDATAPADFIRFAAAPAATVATGSTPTPGVMDTTSWVDAQHRTLTMAERELMMLRGEVDGLRAAKAAAAAEYTDTIEALQRRLAAAKKDVTTQVQELQAELAESEKARRLREREVRTLQKDRVLLVDTQRKEVAELVAHHARMTRDAEDRWQARMHAEEAAAAKVQRRLQRKIDALRRGIRSAAAAYQNAAAASVNDLAAAVGGGVDGCVLSDALQSLEHLGGPFTTPASAAFSTPATPHRTYGVHADQPAAPPSRLSFISADASTQEWVRVSPAADMRRVAATIPGGNDVAIAGIEAEQATPAHHCRVGMTSASGVGADVDGDVGDIMPAVEVSADQMLQASCPPSPAASCASASTADEAEKEGGAHREDVVRHPTIPTPADMGCGPPASASRSSTGSTCPFAACARRTRMSSLSSFAGSASGLRPPTDQPHDERASSAMVGIDGTTTDHVMWTPLTCTDLDAMTPAVFGEGHMEVEEEEESVVPAPALPCAERGDPMLSGIQDPMGVGGADEACGIAAARTTTPRVGGSGIAAGYEVLPLGAAHTHTPARQEATPLGPDAAAGIPGSPRGYLGALG